jgi:arsenate reductase-like glutaredoxin family protein
MKARIYHNPGCSKSRAALALLGKLGIDAMQLVRTNEPEFKSLLPDRTPTEDQLLDLTE